VRTLLVAPLLAVLLAGGVAFSAWLATTRVTDHDRYRRFFGSPAGVFKEAMPGGSAAPVARGD